MFPLCRECPERRRAFTLIELLVAIGIAGVLIGLLLPAIQAASESAHRAHCSSNLRQFGVAIDCYQQAFGVVPNEHNYPWLSPQPVMVALMPYLEAGNAVTQINSTTYSGVGVKWFVCPSRRRVTSAPKIDYSIGESVSSITTMPPCEPWDSVLAAKNTTWVTYPTIMQCDGLSNTLLMAHKAMRPMDYSSPDGYGTPDFDTTGMGMDAYNPATNQIYVNDGGYTNVLDSYHDWGTSDFLRMPNTISKDSNATSEICENIGSPHGTCPGLFCDGSVRGMPYSLSGATMIYLWTYNDGQSIPDMP